MSDPMSAEERTYRALYEHAQAEMSNLARLMNEQANVIARQRAELTTWREIGRAVLRIRADWKPSVGLPGKNEYICWYCNAWTIASSEADLRHTDACIVTRICAALGEDASADA